MNPILFFTQALLVIAPPTAGAHEETICFVADTTYNTGNYEYEALQLLDFIVPPHSTWAPLSTAIRRSSHQLPVSGCVGWLLADAMNPILFFTQALLVIAPPTAGAHEETICFVADTTYNTGNYEYEALQLLDFIVPPHSTWAPLSTAIRRSSHQLPISGCVGWLLADAMNPILFFTQALLLIAPPTAGAHEETICFVADTTIQHWKLRI
ncbi:hypothetical protein MTO96_001185 [Rhipicephalus appendiculatus]